MNGVAHSPKILASDEKAATTMTGEFCRYRLRLAQFTYLFIISCFIHYLLLCIMQN